MKDRLDELANEYAKGFLFNHLTEGGKLTVMTKYCEDLQSQLEKENCNHKIVDARNEVIKSGYMCIKCNKVFESGDNLTQTKEDESSNI